MTKKERAALDELLRWVEHDGGSTTASELFSLAWAVIRERRSMSAVSFAIKDGDHYWTHGFWTKNARRASRFYVRKEALAMRDYLRSSGDPHARIVKVNAPHNGAPEK